MNNIVDLSTLGIFLKWINSYLHYHCSLYIKKILWEMNYQRQREKQWPKWVCLTKRLKLESSNARYSFLVWQSSEGSHEEPHLFTSNHHRIQHITEAIAHGNTHTHTHVRTYSLTHLSPQRSSRAASRIPSSFALIPSFTLLNDA